MPSSIAQCQASPDTQLQGKARGSQTVWLQFTHTARKGKTTWMRRILVLITQLGASGNIPGTAPAKSQARDDGETRKGVVAPSVPTSTHARAPRLPAQGRRSPARSRAGAASLQSPYVCPLSGTCQPLGRPAPERRPLGHPQSSPWSRERAESPPLGHGWERSPFCHLQSPPGHGWERRPLSHLRSFPGHGWEQHPLGHLQSFPGHGWAHGPPARGSPTSAARRRVVPWRAAPPRPTPRLTS